MGLLGAAVVALGEGDEVGCFGAVLEATPCAGTVGAQLSVTSATWAIRPGPRNMVARRVGVGAAGCIVGGNVSRHHCQVPLRSERSVGLNTCLSKCKTLSPKTRAHVGRYSTIFLWHRDRPQQFRVLLLVAQPSERHCGRCGPTQRPGVHPRRHRCCRRRLLLLSGSVARPNYCPS